MKHLDQLLHEQAERNYQQAMLPKRKPIGTAIVVTAWVLAIAAAWIVIAGGMQILMSLS